MVAKTNFHTWSINWLTEISAIAGGLNEFRDVELASVQTDWEDMLQRDPRLHTSRLGWRPHGKSE